MVKTQERLKNGLQNKVSVYVPSTSNVSEKIDNSAYVNKVMKNMSLLFGGTTNFETLGSYISENDLLVIESITIVSSYTNQLDNEKIDEILNICEWLKEEMKQECISLEINNSLHFI